MFFFPFSLVTELANEIMLYAQEKRQLTIWEESIQYPIVKKNKQSREKRNVTFKSGDKNIFSGTSH